MNTITIPMINCCLKIIDIEVHSPAASQGSGNLSPLQSLDDSSLEIGYPESGPTQAGESVINLGLLIEKSNKNKLHFNQDLIISRSSVNPVT